MTEEETAFRERNKDYAAIFKPIGDDLYPENENTMYGMYHMGDELNRIRARKTPMKVNYQRGYPFNDKRKGEKGYIYSIDVTPGSCVCSDDAPISMQDVDMWKTWDGGDPGYMSRERERWNNLSSKYGSAVSICSSATTNPNAMHLGAGFEDARTLYRTQELIYLDGDPIEGYNRKVWNVSNFHRGTNIQGYIGKREEVSLLGEPAEREKWVMRESTELRAWGCGGSKAYSIIKDQDGACVLALMGGDTGVKILNINGVTTEIGFYREGERGHSKLEYHWKGKGLKGTAYNIRKRKLLNLFQKNIKDWGYAADRRIIY